MVLWFVVFFLIYYRIERHAGLHTVFGMFNLHYAAVQFESFAEFFFDQRGLDAAQRLEQHGEGVLLRCYLFDSEIVGYAGSVGGYCDGGVQPRLSRL